MRAAAARGLALRFLTEPLPPDAACAMPGVGGEVAEEFRAGLAAEVASVGMRPGMREVWEDVRGSGLRVGVCSNLAQPYGAPLLACLPDAPDAAILSYEVGVAKPDPRIYALACEMIGAAPSEILFVGDTPSADVEGPRAFGMRAMLVGEFEALVSRSSAPSAR